MSVRIRVFHSPAAQRRRRARPVGADVCVRREDKVSWRSHRLVATYSFPRINHVTMHKVL